MNRVRVWACALLLVIIGLAGQPSARTPVFLFPPYLQLGTDVRPGTLTLTWMAPDEGAQWSVEATGARAGAVRTARLAVLGKAYAQYSATLVARGAFSYRVVRDGHPVFTARAQGPPNGGASSHVALLGDSGMANEPQRALARVMFQQRPDLVLIAGDVVYPRGQQRDVAPTVHDVYNADSVGAAGAPLMRAVPFVTTPGNHDVPGTDTKPVRFDKYPDALAWFYVWLEPLNGPYVRGPRLEGPPERIEEVRAAAGARFPRMGSFSFDWGCAHWLVLDSNRYVDWTDPSLRRWVAADLAAAQGAAWRFVVMHHPGFQGALRHQEDQWMRSLSDLFEQGRVSVVFAGHVHNYQRSRPLRFRPVRQANGRIVAADGRVDGRLDIDEAFDGVGRTRPDGIVYVVSGAGGARLYPIDPPPGATAWGAFTARAVADQWSITDLSVEPRSLTLRELGVNGQELDRITITR